MLSLSYHFTVAQSSFIKRHVKLSFIFHIKNSYICKCLRNSPYCFKPKMLHIGVGGGGGGRGGCKSQSPADLTRGGGEMVIFFKFCYKAF